MDCRTFESKIPAYIAGQLKIEEMQEFLDHAKSCRECYDELEITYSVMQGIRELDSEDGLTENPSVSLNSSLFFAEDRVHRPDDGQSGKVCPQHSGILEHIVYFMVSDTFLAYITRTEEKMSEKIVLMDGYSILNRAFYGIPDLTNSAGLHTNAVYGFCNIMLNILEEEKPQFLAIAFDVKAPTFRHKMYPEYKGTRKPMPQELHEQVPLLKELLHAMRIATVEKSGMEADDIIGTLSVTCKNQGMDVVIVSGDRDLLQAADEHVFGANPQDEAYRYRN